ncbi:MAG: heparinase II/III family protein [Alphaproteobacteria bacterium]
MTQIDIFGRVERWRDSQAFGMLGAQARQRRLRLRPLAARLLDLLPVEHWGDKAHGRPPWLGIRDIWPGDPAQGATFIGAWGADADALFELASDVLPHAHAFDWLRDLDAADTAEARAMAYAATRGWLDRYGRWHPLAWRSDLLAHRLAGWAAHLDLIAAGAPDAAAADAIRAALILSARRQLRFLCRTGAADIDGQPQLGALCHGIVAAIALAPGKTIAAQTTPAAAARLQRWLAAALEVQLHPDGGHVSRSPTDQFALVCHLAAARAALADAVLGVPGWLQHALDKAAPILRMLRHGDGRLALFQGSHEGRSGTIDLALDRSGATGASPTVARHCGYARIAVGNALLLMDCGQTGEHAAPLAIELSVGHQRVFVNCGAMANAGDAWRSAVRATAAHSTLTVADTNADTRGGGDAQPTLTEHDGAWLLEASSAGYAPRFGLVHKRSIYCAADGQDWRGEDVLAPVDAKAQERRGYALRFHMHPRIRATLAQDQATVLIRLPDKSGWRFRVAGGQARLAASIYVADGETVQRNEQIVVTGMTGSDGARVRWALQRLA